MITVTDGLTWLAIPQSIAFGGYSEVPARGLGAGELVSRLTASVFGPTRTARARGRLLTGEDLIDVVEKGSWDHPYPAIGLRYGAIASLSL